MNKEVIQNYINNFRRRFSPYLKKNIGFKTVVIPYDQGVILSFELGMNAQNKDEYKGECKNISEALGKLKLKSFEENSNVVFKGTNIVMENNVIALIKDFAPNEWTDIQAMNDVSKILNTSQQK